MNDVQYNFDEIKDQVIGAGMLPIAMDSAQKPMILLGKERYVSHWRGSLKWSGFEGGRKCGETVEYTAAREFVEESLGCIPCPDIGDATTDMISGIVNMLQAGKYFARIILCILHADSVQKRYHVTYLVEVPYSDDYVEDFKRKRQCFVDLSNKSEQLHRTIELLDRSLPTEDLSSMDTRYVLCC